MNVSQPTSVSPGDGQSIRYSYKLKDQERKGERELHNDDGLVDDTSIGFLFC